MKGILLTSRKALPGILLAALLFAGLALVFPVRSAAAESGLAQDPQPPGETAETPDPARLERAFQREIRLLETQADRLDAMEERAGNYADRIAGLESDGKDVSALEEALAIYKTRLEGARRDHAEAAAILDTHAGFDAAGKVTVPAQAAQTVRQAEKIMRDIHRDLRPAAREMLKALREFRRDN